MSIYTLIPALPLAASVVLALFGRRLEGRGHRIVVPAVAGSFVLAILAFVEVATNGAIEVPLYRLLESGNLVVDMALFIDPLTVLLLVLVTGVSAVVQVYSSRYMIGDARHSRFFAVTALFTSAMILLVMSRNLFMTYMFWEVMGICSYLLISHYAGRRQAHRAATKVFLVNSIADVGLGFGVILTFQTFQTLDIPQILASADSADPARLTLISLLLFMGAVGKSAQMPLHVWLPLAMEAPTPVSALIHAATMVNAGPFLLVRLSPLFVLSPTAMTVIAIVGGATALFAALVSTTQTDVKRILAYSTISQLGFMTMLCGVGAFVAAIFHLIAHGFFKGFLFLSTGNVLASTHRFHATSRTDEEPGRSRGLVVGALALSAIPPLVIFSKPYEQLWLSPGFTQASVAYWVVGLGTVFFTSVYLFRGITTLFRQGPPNARGAAAAEVLPTFFSPLHVTGVLVAVSAAWLSMMAVWSWFSAFLSPAVAGAAGAAVGSGAGLTLRLVVPLTVALAGFVFAYSRYRSGAPSLVERAAWAKPAYVFFLNKGYFDEVYDAFVVRPTIGLAGWLWRTVDTRGIDRRVVAAGAGTESTARWLWRTVDTKGIDRLVLGVGTVTVSVARWLFRFLDMGGLDRTGERLAQGVDSTGEAMQGFEPRTLQQNLLVMIYWLVAALGFFYWIA